MPFERACCNSSAVIAPDLSLSTLINKVIIRSHYSQIAYRRYRLNFRSILINVSIFIITQQHEEGNEADERVENVRMSTEELMTVRYETFVQG